MKKTLFYISVLLCILLVFGFSGCKTVKEIISGKDYGNYTSITVRITVDYYGLNSTGFRKLTINNDVAFNDKFTIFGTAFENAICPDDYTFDKSYSADTKISTTSMTVISEFINWDYTVFKKFATNWKGLCTMWSGEIVSYTYESGKDDPGSPVISGFELLNGFDIENHCTSDGFRIHNCKHEVELTFASAYTSLDENAAEFVSASSCSSYISD